MPSQIADFPDSVPASPTPAPSTLESLLAHITSLFGATSHSEIAVSHSNDMPWL